MAKKIIIAVVVIVLIVVGVFIFKSRVYTAYTVNPTTSGGGQYVPVNPITPTVSAPETDNRIIIENFAFNPAEVKIKVGDKVVWTNKDSVPHRIEIAGDIKSPNLSKNNTFEFTFTKAGEFSYICGIHPSMKGRVVVSEK